MFVLDKSLNERSLLRQRLFPGAPGLYRHRPVPSRSLLPSRMDVCGFVGVAPRGPARVPMLDEAWQFDRPCVEAGRKQQRSIAVPVDSFEDYQRLFGGFHGPGRLPYAVSSFFAQGGQRAYVVRIVHEYDDDKQNRDAVARGKLPDVVARNASGIPVGEGARLLARSEGRWGNGIRTALGYSLTPVTVTSPTLDRLPLLDPSSVTAGALLRITGPGGQKLLRFVRTLARVRNQQSETVTQAVLESPLPTPPVEVELVEATLLVRDAQNEERHERLGLSFGHPRWIASVLCYESELLWPAESWAEGDLQPASELLEHLPGEPQLSRSDVDRFDGGEDRYDDITHDDFFDADWDFADSDPGNGIHALLHQSEIASVSVPDLYVPEPLPPADSVVDPHSAEPEFVRCINEPRPVPTSVGPRAELPRLDLDPTDSTDFQTIISLQQRLVEIAERSRAFVALLDVPPGIGHQQILKWRTRFRSSFAAACHPWVQIALADSRSLAALNPSAVVAGIIAAREISFGVPTGPANVLARNVINVIEEVSPARHDALHPQGINVFLRERDGIRLTAARTLSVRPLYRQLNVRRLMMMMRRVLERQMQWMVFEPNTPSLWADVRYMLTAWLRQLFEQGAFRGATEEEAFFVKCDGDLNTQHVIDSGQLRCDIGVAPAEPIEFIVLKLTAGADGTEVREVTA